MPKTGCLQDQIDSLTRIERLRDALHASCNSSVRSVDGVSEFEFRSDTVHGQQIVVESDTAV